MHLTKEHDIALIRVVKSMDFSEFARPACLHTNMRDQDSTVNLTVTGWGIVSNERKLE